MRERVCKNCGGREYKVVGQNMVKCAFCGTLYVDEHANKEEEVLLVGARELARELRFEEAVEEYEKILSIFPQSFESYFGKALAKNKINLYTNKKGTSRRPRFFDGIVSILEDEDFKRAVKLAPQEVVASYNKIAKRIDKIKKEYDEKTSKNTYDIFLCVNGEENAEIVQKTQEILKENGFSVYYMPSKEKEEGTFRALETCKALLFFALKKDGFAEFKHLADRYKNFILQQKKVNTSLIFALDETIVPKAHLPRDFSFCKNVIDTNSISFLQDVEVLVKNEVENFVSKTAKIDTIKLKKVKPKKKKYANVETVTPTEFGHYEVQNVSLSDKNKIKWIFLSLKNGDFATAQEIISAELEKDPYNSELLFADLMAEKNIKTQEEFFASISNFADKERIEAILRYATKDFAENFVDNWEKLVESLDAEEYYCAFLLYLAGFQTPNRENFIKAAEQKAVETLNDDLIEQVQKCFDKEDVNRFIQFYFALAQKSDDEKYYHQILELDAGHSQSNMAVLLKHFRTAEDKLSYRDRAEVEEVFKFLDENTRKQFVSAIVDLIMSVAFYDLARTEEQLDFYLAYISDEKQLAEICRSVAERFQQMGFFTQAEKYISIAISKDKERGELYWLLIQIKAHCKSDNELIMADVKVTQMPEWQSLLEFSDDQQNEYYASIASKANLFKGKRLPRQNEFLDKVKMAEKLKEFLLRNEKILLEIEKQEGAAAQSGVNYFRSQLVPFELYITDIDTQTYEEYCKLIKKIEERLDALDLGLDESINVTKLLGRCGQAKISELKDGKERKFEKDASNTYSTERQKRTKFIKKFLCIFLEFYPLLFSTLLFAITIFLPKSVFLHFTQEFLIISLIYSVAVGVANLTLFVLKKRNVSKGWHAVFGMIFSIAVLNLALFSAGFYFSPNTIQISNAKEMATLIHNASYANFQLDADIDFADQAWESCSFHGKLDGNGHKISNAHGGLFSTNSGEIKNIQVEFSGLHLQDIGIFGAICTTNTGSIENCKVGGDISVETDRSLVFGGLVGRNLGGTILGCNSTLDITINSQGDATIGGVVGEMLAGKYATKFEKNLAENSISVFANLSEVQIGGLAGLVNRLTENSDISQNVVDVDIVVDGTSLKLCVGALFGKTGFASHDNRASGQISTTQMTGDGFVGGLIGSYINAQLTEEVLHSVSSVTIDTQFVCGSLFGELGGRANACFAFGFDELSPLAGKVSQFGGMTNCKNELTWQGSPLLGFDKNVWNFSIADLPQLKWEAENK